MSPITHDEKIATKDVKKLRDLKNLKCFSMENHAVTSNVSVVLVSNELLERFLPIANLPRVDLTLAADE